MRRPLTALCLLAGALLPCRADDAKPAIGGKPGIAFRVDIDADLKVSAGKASAVRLRALSDFDYRLVPRGKTVETAIDRFSLTKAINGREVDSIEMSRSGIRSSEKGGEAEVHSRGDLKPRELDLVDQFETTLAVLTLDAEGAEVSRELKKKEGFFVDNNLLENARIFHPRFAKALKAWDAPAAFPLGDRQMARGTLHYAKQSEPRKGGLVGVEVSGDLAVGGKMGRAEIKKGSYKVKGEQTYDPAIGQWVAGRLEIEMEFEGVLPDGSTVKGGGPVVMRMNRLDDPAEAKLPSP